MIAGRHHAAAIGARRRFFRSRFWIHAAARDARRRFFRARFWISMLDCIFDTWHWADDQQVLKKRNIELGGACSVATLILLIGLVTVLLYQAIKKRNVEVHRVKPATAPDLLSFNDIEFHITTVSAMSCAQLSPLSTPDPQPSQVSPPPPLLQFIKSCVAKPARNAPHPLGLGGLGIWRLMDAVSA